jgi:hypothetical protein
VPVLSMAAPVSRERLRVRASDRHERVALGKSFPSMCSHPTGDAALRRCTLLCKAWHAIAYLLR